MDQKKYAVTETPLELQEVIHKILDTDAKAKEITSQAVTLRSDAEKNLVARKKELRKEYLDRADQRIEELREEERNLADVEVAATEEEQGLLLQRLEEQYKAGKSAWVQELFEQVISQ